jgi:hypothetical protein
MNKFIQAIQSLDYSNVEQLISKDPKWLQWSEKNGKNALHFLGSIDVSKDSGKAESSLKITQLLLKNGMDINSIHHIPEKDGFFFATPLWHAYTRGRNEKLYTYYLKNGANPNGCMFAIAWNNDVEAAELFKKHGAKISGAPFLAAFYWKRYSVAEWFLKNGANVNYVGPEDYSALMLAVKRKVPIEQAKMLLQYGADINKENKKGLSPKKLAESGRQKEVLKLFETYRTLDKITTGKE